MSSTGFFDTPEQQNIVKTELVIKYFKAWSDIMLAYAKGPSPRIAYVDLFSGPGVFSNGEPSTPLWIVNHAIANPRLCADLVIMFNDKDYEYAERLRDVINAVPEIENLAHQPQVSNTAVGSEMADILRSTRRVPTLFFIDPWGYKGLSLELIGSAIRNWGCDCIFFFNYNRVNPGISNPSVIGLMNDLFGPGRADRLRDKVRGQSSDGRQSIIINELAEALREVGGRFVLPFEFRSSYGQRTSHYIIFVSKNFLGYHLMKEVMSKLTSDEGEVRSFEYTPVKSPQLRLLFDLAAPFSITALKENLLGSFAGETLSARTVYERCSVDTPYTLKNVKDAIKELEADGEVTVDIPAEKRRRRGEVTLADGRSVTFRS